MPIAAAAAISFWQALRVSAQSICYLRRSASELTLKEFFGCLIGPLPVNGYVCCVQLSKQIQLPRAATICFY